MRIGIDARFYGSLGKGLGRYTQKLIENLEKIDQSNQYFIFLKKENFDEYDPKNNNFKKVLADYRWYTFSEQINMPKVLNRYNLDLVHFPHFNIPIFYRKPFVVTIHDLILIHFPTIRGTTLNPFFYWLKFLVYKAVIGLAIKKSSKIIAVSNFTKKDILKNYKVEASKIKVTYESSESASGNIMHSNEDNDISKKYGIIKPYILYVGNAYPHKNLERLVLSFGRAREKNPELNLVLVGKEDYFYKRLRVFIEKKDISNVIFTDFVSDVDLDELYKKASFYIFPSLYEGFGLPPLEAMVRGVAVASSNHECMKEILGESAYYFDAKNKKEITEAINKIFNDDKLKSELVKKGHSQFKKYSWLRMAEKTLKTYKEQVL